MFESSIETDRWSKVIEKTLIDRCSKWIVSVLSVTNWFVAQLDLPTKCLRPPTQKMMQSMLISQWIHIPTAKLHPNHPSHKHNQKPPKPKRQTFRLLKENDSDTITDCIAIWILCSSIVRIKDSGTTRLLWHQNVPSKNDQQVVKFIKTKKYQMMTLNNYIVNVLNTFLVI